MGFKSDGIRWTWSDSYTTTTADDTTKGIGSTYTTTTTTGDPIEINSPISNAPTTYGWICPKCGRSNSPWTSTCWCWALGPNGVPIIKC